MSLGHDFPLCVTDLRQTIPHIARLVGLERRWGCSEEKRAGSTGADVPKIVSIGPVLSFPGIQTVNGKMTKAKTTAKELLGTMAGQNLYCLSLVIRLL